MASFAGGLVLLVLAYPSFLMLRTFFRRTKPFWLRTLFPLGYALYKTRIGYGLHLRKLKKLQQSPPHSITSPTKLSVVTILPVAVLDDNYSYLIIDTVTSTAVAVDPCDPSAVMKAVKDNGVSLTAILTTHKHWDHAGGNELLRKRLPNLMIYGGVKEGVAGATHEVQDRDCFKVTCNWLRKGDHQVFTNFVTQIGRLTFEAIWTPGHTTGHMMYKLVQEPPCVFSGDHLFICGNGQMFEGTPEVMLSSIKKTMLLPKNTLVFPGHEYAQKNVIFTSHLLPTNKAVQMKSQWVKQQRERRLSTVPSILSEEMRHNPFLLTEDSTLKEALGLPETTPPAQVLAELRKQKNEFQKSNF